VTTTRVFVFRRRLATAACGCGWWGRRRILRALAVYDALTHCAEVGCRPAEILVVDLRAALAVTVADGATLHLRTASFIGRMHHDRHQRAD
jgi:kynureninase